jgi:hypothetical protein
MGRAAKTVGVIAVMAVAIVAGTRWVGRVASGMRAAPNGGPPASGV